MTDPGSLFVLIPSQVFSKEDTKSTTFKNKISKTFVAFVIFVVRKIFGDQCYHEERRPDNLPKLRKLPQLVFGSFF